MNPSDPNSSQLGPTGLQVEIGARPKRRLWMFALPIAVGVALLVVAATVILQGESPSTPAPTATPPSAVTPPAAVNLSSNQLFLHGAGTQPASSTLFLDAIAPTGSTAKYKDSAGVKFSGGNPWVEIGTWTATLAGSNAATPTSLDTWVGLKNSDDIGTTFDVRAEVYQNTTLVASGESRCITGITRNAGQAKPVNVQLAAANVLTGTGTLNLKLLTRIGTNADGTRCSGPGFTHSNAVGLRAYFDATNRSSKLNVNPWPTFASLELGLTVNYPPGFYPRESSAASSPGIGFYDSPEAHSLGHLPTFRLSLDSLPDGLTPRDWIARFGVRGEDITELTIGSRQFLRWLEPIGDEMGFAYSFTLSLPDRRVVTFTTRSGAVSSSPVFLTVLSSLQSQ